MLCSRSPGDWGWYPSMPCRFPGPHPGGEVEGTGQGGIAGPHPEGCIPACTEADPTPMATAAGGTHPTGMHSC